MNLTFPYFNILTWSDWVLNAKPIIYFWEKSYSVRKYYPLYILVNYIFKRVLHLCSNEGLHVFVVVTINIFGFSISIFSFSYNVGLKQWASPFLFFRGFMNNLYYFSLNVWQNSPTKQSWSVVFFASEFLTKNSI